MFKSDILKILGHNYKIEYCENVYQEHEACGIHVPAFTKIKISPIHPISRQEEALIHEIVEALNFHLELGLEHKQISGLSEGLYQVLKDNKFLKGDE